jgi:tRNA/tmRNA/rRNA uracil-C5-methylase (TrmA/RlmC/RlmD family)
MFTREDKSAELEWELRDEDRQFSYELRTRASAKSIAYAKSLIERAKKVPSLREKAIAREVALTETNSRYYTVVPYNIRTVSHTIEVLKQGLETLPQRTPKVTVSVANVEPATTKQIGFMNSLLKRKDVSAELVAQVEEAKGDKRKASKVIDALTKCADKVAVA